MSKKKVFKLYDVVKFSSIKEMMELAVKDAGDKAAFKYRDGEKIISVTYREFNNDTMYLGSGLTSLGLGGAHVAMLGENSYDWVTVYLTVLKSSGVYVPIDKELPLSDIINVLNHSDSEAVVYSKKFEDELMANVDKLPNIKYFIGLSRENDEGKFLSFNSLKEKGKAIFDSGDRTYADLTSDENALKMLVYTSGTTGMAKGVMLSEHNLVSSVYYGLQVSTVFEKNLSVLPYHHTYEAVSGLLVSLHHHSTICINENLKTVLKNLQAYKPEYIYLVPAFVETFYKRIWSNAKQTGKDKALKKLISTSNAMLKVGIDMRKVFFASIHKVFGGKLTKIVCGGAPIRPELGYFFEAIGIHLINGYGITECSPLVSANPDGFNDCSTVGMPLPCCQIKFENMTPDGEGEICVKGDVVMMGYYKQPELTAEVLVDDWFYTGDYGKLTADGQLCITGRKKNLIVLSNGKNVFPEEIENYILAIPYVNEAVVYGIKDGNGQESGLCAEVFLSAEKIEELDIKNPELQIKKDITAALENLPNYKHMAKIKVRDTEFVKTTTNKIRRSEIKKD